MRLGERSLFTKKNWICLILIIFEIFSAYALFSGLINMAEGKTYPYLWYGGTLCVLGLALIFVYLMSDILAHLNLPDLLPLGDRRSVIIERIVVGVVILASAILRILVIERFPILPSSDYQVYFQVAELLSKGKLGTSDYCSYIAEFPHIVGFPFILSLLFRITGPSLKAGLYFNMAASLLSVFLTYRISRTLCGRLGGVIALLAAAFWPSQILYGTILASEPVFTCMFLFCIWLFIYLFRYPAKLNHIEGSIILCVLLGVLISLTNAVRPQAIILLIAVILCLIPMRVQFDKSEKMLNGKLRCAACQGWFRALIILFSFMICSQLVSTAISKTIAYELPGMSTSFGFNLMVGVHIDAKGAWNQQDADFLTNQFAATHSAEKAHQACLSVALSRIKSNPIGVLNLSLEKFTFLWGNDDYAASWATFLLDQQGNLTSERQHLIQTITPWNNDIYLVTLFLSAVLGMRSFKQREIGPTHVLMLIFIGTALLHMILEWQNRYHYFVLPVFMILASMAFADIYHEAVHSRMKSS